MSILGMAEAKLKELRVKWIERHGSERLKKAVALDVLDAVLSVYREERLRLERPGWVFPDNKDQLHEIRNPSEEALDLLAEIRKTFPRASLVSVKTPTARKEAVCVVEPFGQEDPTPRPALIFVKYNPTPAPELKL